MLSRLPGYVQINNNQLNRQQIQEEAEGNTAQKPGGCKMCGQNVIYLDGKCDVYNSSGIVDSKNGVHANYAQDSRGRQRQKKVLFDDFQGCTTMYHLPMKIPDSLFDELDADDVPTQPEPPLNPAPAALITQLDEEMDAVGLNADFIFDGL